MTIAVFYAFSAALLLPTRPPPRATVRATETSYDSGRAVNIVKELASRAAGLSIGTPDFIGGGTDALKGEILSLIAPYGDPALNIGDETFEAVDDACRQLERRNPTPANACIDPLEGAWKVRYSDAPPPSNGALGPIRGKAFQIIDVASRTYSNELSVFGGALQLKLKATFTQPDPNAAALRVAFRSIRAILFGIPLGDGIQFPEGTERTWLLTYTDEDTRIVRAGVDGGRSTVRDLGLIAKEEGEAADSYLFVLTRAKAAESEIPANPLQAAAQRRALKEELLALTEGENLGASTTEETREEISELMDRLAALNPTEDTASSPLLVGTWDIVWTTESELLYLTENGFAWLPCTGAYQTIERERDAEGGGGWRYSLGNAIDFDGGYLRVDSTCEPEPSGGRVNFKFEGCEAKWKALTLPLPPVGSGWFECIYVDEDVRLARDLRGDLQVCRRR